MIKFMYEKFSNDAISIKLHNGFTIIAMKTYNKESALYNVTFYIKADTVDLLDLIHSQENVEFEDDYKSINIAILKYVSSLQSCGFFDRAIERYEYMLKCFDKGNEFFENER